MMLWLPLQAVAGIGAPVCVGAAQVALAPDAQAHPDEADAGHRHHASTSVDQGASGHALDHSGDQQPADPDAAVCGDCSMACAALAPLPRLTASPIFPCAGLVDQGDESFASASSHQAFKPPITAA